MTVQVPRVRETEKVFQSKILVQSRGCTSTGSASKFRIFLQWPISKACADRVRIVCVGNIHSTSDRSFYSGAMKCMEETLERVFRRYAFLRVTKGRTSNLLERTLKHRRSFLTSSPKRPR